MEGREEHEPVRKALVVPATPDVAFQRFTEGMGRWWPLATFSVGMSKAVTVSVEPGAGGRIYEQIAGGGEVTWGRVRAWEPPTRLVFTWHPGYEGQHETVIEVRFEPVPQGTRVELMHTGWDEFGEQAAERRESYVGGWDIVLAAYAGGF